MNGLSQREHRALKAIALQFFINGAVVASYIPRLPGIRDELSVTLSTIGLIIAVATGLGVVGSVLQGPIVERFGNRNAMIYGAGVMVLLLPLVGFSPTWWMLLIVLGSIAVCDVIVDVAMNTQGSVLSSRRDAPVMNRLHGMWSLGTVVGAIVSTLMASLDISLRVHLIGAALVLAATLTYVAPGLLNDREVGSATREPSNPTSRGTNRSVVLAFAALGGAAVVPEMINTDWAAFRLSDDFDASAAVSALGYVAFTSGMVTGRFAGDAVVARLGSATVLRRATMLAAAGSLIAMVIPLTAAVFIGLVLAGLGVSVMFPQLYDAAAQHAQTASALGGLTAGTRLVLLVAPLVVGQLADTDLFNVGAAIAVLTVPSTALVWLLSTRLLSPSNS